MLSEIVIVVVRLPSTISASVVGDKGNDYAAAEHREQLFRGGISISASKTRRGARP